MRSVSNDFYECREWESVPKVPRKNLVPDFLTFGTSINLGLKCCNLAVRTLRRVRSVSNDFYECREWESVPKLPRKNIIPDFLTFCSVD